MPKLRGSIPLSNGHTTRARLTVWAEKVSGVQGNMKNGALDLLKFTRLWQGRDTKSIHSLGAQRCLNPVLLTTTGH